MDSPKTYSCSDVAKMLVVRARRERRQLNQMGLQRLVYYCACFYAHVFERDLLDEPLLATEYGPMVESLFLALLDHQLEPVTLGRLGGPLRAQLEQDSRLVMVVDRVWRSFGRRDWIWLSNSAHIDGAPWDLAFNDLRPAGGAQVVEISIEIIQMGFRVLEILEAEILAQGSRVGEGSKYH